MSQKVDAWFGQPQNFSGEVGKQSRVGGLPFGFSVGRWPTKHDGEQLVFVAQFLAGEIILTDKTIAYVFMAQTYDDSSECINDTFDPGSGTTAVLFSEPTDDQITEGPCLQGVTCFEWNKGYSWNFDATDSTTDEQGELLEQEDEQTYASQTKIGGGVRWWQGGYDHPKNAEGKPMEYVLSFLAEGIPQLDRFIPGIAHVFRDPSSPDKGALVWECD